MTQVSPALSVELAAQLARIALNGIAREYPTYPGHILLHAADLRRTRELHPAFFGCFDWHSAVHSHWLLARLLRRLPALPEAERIRGALNDHLTEANLRAEAAYLAQPGRRSFERPYGWAWLLKLAKELLDWDDLDARRWSAAVGPLGRLIADLYLEYLPRLTYPICTGTTATPPSASPSRSTTPRPAPTRRFATVLSPAAWTTMQPTGMHRQSGSQVAATSCRPAWPRPT